MKLWAALTEQSTDDVYPYESWVRAKLATWQQWVRGDGVSIGGNGLVLDEATARMLEINRDDFRLPIAVCDCERTHRAVNSLRTTDPQGWLALRAYHFGTGSLRASDQGSIARVCKCRRADVRGVLARAHESLYLCW